MMDPESSVPAEPPQMLPPPPGSYANREQLIEHVGDFAISQGYVVIIKKSRKDKAVVLGCDRGGVHRNKRKSSVTESAECTRKRKISSRNVNCPFEVMGKNDGGMWYIIVKNGTHNHEPMKDIAEHPAARRFTEDEVLRIKEMTEAGLKPRQILKKLRQSNPELLSTPKHLYNVKTKLRQGNLTVRKYKSFKPQKVSIGSAQVPGNSVSTEPSWRLRFTRIPNFIGGQFVESQSTATVDIINPATQKVVSILSLTTIEELKAAVCAAKWAFPSWRDTPVTSRKRIVLKLRELIQRDMDKLAATITSEGGKTLKDAYTDVHYSLEALDCACGMATPQMGRFVSNISNELDIYSIREPLGVCAGICLANFPAIIALWMFPVAVLCGNTFILKSSMRDPGVSMILAELALEAGLPNGVLNTVHGTDDVVSAICDDDDVKAVTVAASKAYGLHVHSRASAKGKRVQSYTEGRSHMVVMPDANTDATLNALVPVAFKSEGERCFALSTVIFVGDSKPWECKLVEQAKVLNVNAGTEPDADIGPVMSKQEKDKICKLIESAIERGARLILDGRNIMVSGYQQGNFIGPTIVCDVTADMECFREKMYGPVLLCMQVKSLEEAISIINECRHCNGASIYTASGASARQFQTLIEASQVGINVPVSVRMPFISSGDPEAPFAGQTGVLFYTKLKTVRQQWNDFPKDDEGVPMSASPTPEQMIAYQEGLNYEQRIEGV
ncbi:methylmalonate-semialdehyde dehydrogenase [acylating], mitochondrial-like [Chenopodium quinoa]|uniref:methylmalonate-semialdehyde dehydrogenase [acylating], mitochondrial-like n=1 Tax=Chenopodium quinoa TaxID=63459 RepID=UPI000B78ED53|nr:methylmalonate-semialdehyde dehydrogenase [acylating], mitochondrial-like [Chenopodium quinoa]